MMGNKDQSIVLAVESALYLKQKRIDQLEAAIKAHRDFYNQLGVANTLEMLPKRGNVNAELWSVLDNK